MKGCLQGLTQDFGGRTGGMGPVSRPHSGVSSRDLGDQPLLQITPACLERRGNAAVWAVYFKF